MFKLRLKKDSDTNFLCDAIWRHTRKSQYPISAQDAHKLVTDGLELILAVDEQDEDIIYGFRCGSMIYVKQAFRNNFGIEEQLREVKNEETV